MVKCKTVNRRAEDLTLKMLDRGLIFPTENINTAISQVKNELIYGEYRFKESGSCNKDDVSRCRKSLNNTVSEIMKDARIFARYGQYE